MSYKIWEHIFFLFSGATGLGVVAHAVNTFPTPKNKYGIWFLGLIQYIVGQRTIAVNTFQGLQSESIGVSSENLKEFNKKL